MWIGTVVIGFGNTLNFVYLKLSNRQLNLQSEEDTPYTKTVILLLLGLGFTFLVFLSLWAWSITQTSMGISTVLHNFTPIFTTLSAWIFFGQRFEEKFLIGMVITIVGIVFIGIGDIQITNGINDKTLGDVAALFSAVFYAGYLLIIEQLQSKLSATKILMWSSLTGAILILPIVILTGEKIFPYSWNGWLAVICLAVICQALGMGLVTYSLNKLSAGFVAIFLLIDPVLTAIEAWIIFSERLSLWDWIAFVLVLLGIYLALSSKSSIQQE